jgi:hypothetical protein
VECFAQEANQLFHSFCCLNLELSMFVICCGLCLSAVTDLNWRLGISNSCRNFFLSFVDHVITVLAHFV